ncbi:restriction endonuclease subunit S [Shewanella algae]|uniref:restriction endonuclease subunit S n=1 Tax=Shewanella algae TaxID=38313 RepID=UPI000469FB0D|nr:restriction endonuclease subunit S [Shewanella algae]NKZ42180.1 restriction endonuclease subunit S [Shewanella algae]QTE79432.1 restriction endonuclease subunit S [Shewanella algae]
MSDFEEYVLGEHIESLSGFPFSSEMFSIEDGMPLIRIRNVTDNETPDVFYQGEYSDLYLVENDDVLIGMDGDFHIVRWKGGEGVLNQRVLKIFEKPNSELDMNFVFYWLADFLPKLNAVTAATTVKHLSVKDIATAVVKAPSKEAQTKIGMILRTIDNQIDATQALIDKYTAIKQGMMADLFSRGIDPETKALRPTFEEAPELYHKTPLGMLPKGWSVAKLAKLATKITDGDHHTPKRSSEGRYLLSARNIHDGYLDFSKVDYVPEFEYQRMIKRCFPEAGDIFISCSGSIGRVCEVPENFSCALVRSVALVKLDNNLVQSSYICWWLRTEKMQKAMINSALQAAQPNLFQGAIEQLDAVLCDSEEQFLISERLNAIENMMLLNKRELQKLEVQKAGLMQDLLTGKVPVPA